MQYRLIAFDAYGTLFDVYSIGALAEKLFVGQGKALSVLWRDKQLEYTRLISLSDPQNPSGSKHYQSFWDVTIAALHYSCKQLGLNLTYEYETQLLGQYFVSCNAWDIIGANWFGFDTFWVNRYQLPFEEIGLAPTHQGNDLNDLRQLLLS